MTLPLKMVAFERYMFRDDKPSHPMSCWVEMTFSGTFDPEAFRAALAMAVDRHPLLRARVEGRRNAEMTWVESPEPMPYLDIADRSVPIRFPGSPQIDLRKETGLRIWVRTGDETADVTMQIHHACCDGIGTYAFLEDLLRAYDHLARGKPGRPELPHLEPELLHNRARFGMSRWRALLRLPLDAVATIVGTVNYVCAKINPVAAPEDPQLTEDQKLDVPGLVIHTFDKTELKRLLAVARQSKATLNQLLFRDFFLGVKEWNERNGQPLKRGFLRMMIPFNERGPHDGPMPAANVVGMANIDRGRFWTAKRSRLLWGLKAETRLLQLVRGGMIWARASAVIERIGPLERYFTQSKRCFATGVLSNMGRVFLNMPLQQRDGKLVAGDLVLEGIGSTPPVRHLTSAAFNVTTYAGRLSVALNYDQLRLTRESAEGLMAAIVEQLEESGAEVPEPREEPSAAPAPQKRRATRVAS